MFILVRDFRHRYKQGQSKDHVCTWWRKSFKIKIYLRTTRMAFKLFKKMIRLIFAVDFIVLHLKNRWNVRRLALLLAKNSSKNRFLGLMSAPGPVFSQQCVWLPLSVSACWPPRRFFACASLLCRRRGALSLSAQLAAQPTPWEVIIKLFQCTTGQ